MQLAASYFIVFGGKGESCMPVKLPFEAEIKQTGSIKIALSEL